MSVIKKLGKILLNIFVFFLIQVIVFCTFSIGMVFYGPFSNIRDMVVTSAMTTLRHQYLATWFLSEDKINDIMNKNKINTDNKSSDETAIEVFNKKVGENKNVEDDQKQKSNKIELIDISNGKFKGYILTINDPSRIVMGTSKNIGDQGMKLMDIVKQYNAVGGINAGGFMDENGVGNGGTPQGLLIENYQVVYEDGSTKYSIIGFNEESVLVLGNYTLKEIKEKRIRDAASFGPFLIVNGEPLITEGNGGWGLAPRTAIGQRKDGTIVMLVIDGRQVGSIGATLKEVQDIMIQQKVFNAANLDGGSSTTMVHEGRIINKPSSIYGPRDLPSAFIIKDN